jgi:hypothetical protein
MGHPLETTFAEENKHCLVCHHEDAIAVYHAADDLEIGPFGAVEVTCQNKECKAILYIPRLESPIQATS